MLVLLLLGSGGLSISGYCTWKYLIPYYKEKNKDKQELLEYAQKNDYSEQVASEIKGASKNINEMLDEARINLFSNVNFFTFKKDTNEETTLNMYTFNHYVAKVFELVENPQALVRMGDLQNYISMLRDNSKKYAINAKHEYQDTDGYLSSCFSLLLAIQAESGRIADSLQAETRKDSTFAMEQTLRILQMNKDMEKKGVTKVAEDLKNSLTNEKENGLIQNPKKDSNPLRDNKLNNIVANSIYEEDTFYPSIEKSSDEQLVKEFLAVKYGISNNEELSNVPTPTTTSCI